VCPSHRGYSWSHRPRSRATQRGRKGKAAFIGKGCSDQRGQQYKHYKGRSPHRPGPIGRRRGGAAAKRLLCLIGLVYAATGRLVRKGLVCWGGAVRTSENPVTAKFALFHRPAPDRVLCKQGH
jgi:hypothetical protein